MAATLILGVLLAFGRWASDDPTLMGFGPVAWNAFPAGWILAIEYGVIVSMVAAVIRADRVDALFSSAETLDLARRDRPVHGRSLSRSRHSLHRLTARVFGAAAVNGYGTYH